MGNYQSLALRTSGVTIANAACSIVTGTRRCRVLEISIMQAAAVAQSIGLGFPATAGTPTTPVLFQNEENGVASLTSGYLTWSAQPTAPTIFLRRWNSPASAGAQVIWYFEHGLLIPASSSLVVWNITTGQVMDVNMSIYEEV